MSRLTISPNQVPVVYPGASRRIDFTDRLLFGLVSSPGMNVESTSKTTSTSELGSANNSEIAARITRHARRTRLRLPSHTPWTDLLTTALTRLQPG